MNGLYRAYIYERLMLSSWEILYNFKDHKGTCTLWGIVASKEIIHSHQRDCVIFEANFWFQQQYFLLLFM